MPANYPVGNGRDALVGMVLSRAGAVVVGTGAYKGPVRPTAATEAQSPEPGKNQKRPERAEVAA